MSGSHRMSLHTRARSLASLRRRVAGIGATDAQRVFYAWLYLEQYAVAGRLAQLWSQLMTWELDRVDRATVGAAIEAAVGQARRDYRAHEEGGHG